MKIKQIYGVACYVSAARNAYTRKNKALPIEDSDDNDPLDDGPQDETFSGSLKLLNTLWEENYEAMEENSDDKTAHIEPTKEMWDTIAENISDILDDKTKIIAAIVMLENEIIEKENEPIETDEVYNLPAIP